MKLTSKVTKIKQVVIPVRDLKTTLSLLLLQVESIKGDLDLDKIFNTIGNELQKIKISMVISIIDEKKENVVVRYLKLKDSYQESFLETKIKKIEITKLKKHQLVFNEKRTIFCQNRISQLKKSLPSLKLLFDKIKESNSIISPLILKGEVVGILEIFSKNITEKDVDLVKNFTQDLVLSIANTILFQEIKKSEERYRELWDNAPVAYHILDTKGIIRKVNKTEAKMLGYPPELMIGKSIFEFILPEQRAEARERFRLKLAGQKIPKKENRVYLKQDGSKIYVSIDDILEYGNNGKVIGVRTTMVDITKQKQAEKALYESERRYRLLYESAPMGIGLATLEGQFLACNNSMLQMIGCSKKELKQLNVKNLYGNPKDHQSLLRRLQKDGFVRNFEVKLKRKNKALYYASLTITSLFLDQKDIFLIIAEDITERKWAEKALRENEEKYRKLVDNANDGVIIINVKGYITFANKAFSKISGYNKKELTNLHISRLICPDDYNIMVKRFNEQIKGKKLQTAFEFEGLNKAGKVRYIQFTGTPIIEANKIIGLQAIIRDVTENKKLQKKIEQAKEHYEQVIDTIQDGICVINKNFKIVSCNKEFAKKINLPLTKIKDRNCYDVIPRYKNDLFKKHCPHLVCDKECMADKIFRDGKTLSFIEKDKDSSGKIQHHRISIFPAKNKGEVYQVVLVIEDVTERKMAEEEIRKLHEFNKRILDNAPVSIIVLDKRGVIISVNDLAKKLMEKTEQQAINRKLLDTQTIKNNKELTKKYNLLLTKEKTFYYANMPYFPEGSDKQRYLNIIAVPLFNKNKNIDGAISMALDNTEAVFAKQKLEDLNRNLEKKVIQRTQQLDRINKQLNKVLELKSKFISDASHELRTPLTVIQGNLDLATRETKNLNNEIPETFTLMNKEVEQMSSILTDLTMLTNSDSQTEKLAYEKVDLAPLIKAVSQSLGVLARPKKIKIKSRQRSKQLTIMGDEAKVEKLLLNIVRNAIKYNNENGWVKIWTEKDNSGVNIHVEDNGIGIPGQDLPYIFERFYRVDKARSQGESGTGLGLSIAKWIAEAHQGKISAESTLGKGSKFTIHLPHDYKKQKEKVSLFG